MEKTEKIAVIRIRGNVNVTQKIKDTLQMLKLHRKNTCVVFDKTPSITGMIKKVKDFVTWGEINAETEKELIQKRGQKTKDKEGKETMKTYFRLNPPKGGFERKGIKVSFKTGGVLGYRAEKINDLIKKML